MDGADPAGVSIAGRSRSSRAGWFVASLGIPAAVVAALLEPGAARASAAQVWPPFVLVAGLLLIGLVADDDGLFSSVGDRLARIVPDDRTLFAATVLLVCAVTAVLNLDTSVAFLTPVLVHLARARRSDEAPFVYGCLLLSNAASLLLPGSNLTNLIVLGHLHLSGARFAAGMAPAFAASVAVTSLVLAVAYRHRLRGRATGAEERRGEPDEIQVQGGEHVPGGRVFVGRVPGGRVLGGRVLGGRVLGGRVLGGRVLGGIAVAATTLLVLLLHSPAPWVVALGVGAVSVRLLQGRDRVRRIVDVLGVEMLVGLLGIAVALGTAGRSWSGPSWLLGHLGFWATAAVSAVTSVATNNLPAASLLASRVPPHPYSLLVGLNLGPNLFVTGSLSWLLWLDSARRAGARASIGQVARLGAVVVPASIVAAMAALAASGRH